MAYDDSKKKEEFLESDRSVDDGLATGRIQREKKRSYKDLRQEEDEIATQVRKPSQNRLKVAANHVLYCSVTFQGKRRGSSPITTDFDFSGLRKWDRRILSYP
uniref:Uncharacterized protein n=1 Tax=Melopsittacus undulatus TaxID=13146 RepID=A0A8V5FQN6_MELUD